MKRYGSSEMKEKSVIDLASAWQLRFSASRACLHALTVLLVVFSTGFLPVSAQNDAITTPPFNTVTIDLGGTDARFFKIRVDNLANEVR